MMTHTVETKQVKAAWWDDTLDKMVNKHLSRRCSYTGLNEVIVSYMNT